MINELPLTDTSGEHQHNCGCESATDMEFDVRPVPHDIRHGAVLGALSSLKVGSSFVLIAPHDPKPLLAQIAQLFGDSIEVSYVDRDGDGVGVRLFKTHATQA